MIFEQIKAEKRDNLSYVIGDEKTREVVVIDPSYSAEQLLRFLECRELKVKYVINTHSHRDHTLGNAMIAERFCAKIVAHHRSQVERDLSVNDGDVLSVGKLKISVIHTPGHSPDSICLLVDGKLLTGDTLFVGECGRTDIPGGSSEDLYYSLFGKLLKLDDDVEVYPGHHYRSGFRSTIGREKKTNYILVERTLEEFLEFMRRMFIRGVWVSLEYVE